MKGHLSASVQRYSVRLHSVSSSIPKLREEVAVLRYRIQGIEVALIIPEVLDVGHERDSAGHVGDRDRVMTIGDDREVAITTAEGIRRLRPMTRGKRASNVQDSIV